MSNNDNSNSRQKREKRKIGKTVTGGKYSVVNKDGRCDCCRSILRCSQRPAVRKILSKTGLTPENSQEFGCLKIDGVTSKPAYTTEKFSRCEG